MSNGGAHLGHLLLVHLVEQVHELHQDVVAVEVLEEVDVSHEFTEQDEAVLGEVFEPLDAGSPVGVSNVVDDLRNDGPLPPGFLNPGPVVAKPEDVLQVVIVLRYELVLRDVVGL